MAAADARPPYRYGDFPELFWDAEPDAPIDLTSSVTLARLLTRARAETIAQLVPPELLRERLDSLELPENTRIFWRAVLEGAARGSGNGILSGP